MAARSGKLPQDLPEFVARHLLGILKNTEPMSQVNELSCCLYLFIIIDRVVFNDVYATYVGRTYTTVSEEAGVPGRRLTAMITRILQYTSLLPPASN